ncbi:MAG: hypothetical protein AMXMBFR84_12890 [Candidatus Hydrogenedentota bacterium]
MRPYLAIIRDCFHEAFSSRVLWILVSLTTLILVVLSMFSVYEQPPTRIRPWDFNDMLGFARTIAGASDDGELTPADRVWDVLDADLQARLKQRLEDSGRGRRRMFGAAFELADAISDMDDPQSFYDPEAWKNTELSDEAKQLLDKGVTSLSEPEVRHLNVLLISDAFPAMIERRTGFESRLTFLGMDSGDSLPIPRETVIGNVINSITSFLVGVLGLFVALLVTASMIPQTYNEGAIELLLSKPINRSMLFLSKYVGGCAFVLINSVYLLGGLWLLAGVRFNYWQSAILVCIGLLILLFMIYYAVSALAGVIWRNAIVSVVVTIIFWFTCTIVGIVKQVTEEIVFEPSEASHVIAAGDRVVMTSRQGSVYMWEPGSNDWMEILRTNTEAIPLVENSVLAIAYDSVGDRLLAFQELPLEQLASIAGGEVSMEGAFALIIGRQEFEWERESGPVLRDHPRRIIPTTEGLVFVEGAEGLYRLDTAGDEPRFVEVAQELELNSNVLYALNPSTLAIAVVNGQFLTVYERGSDGFYIQTKRQRLEEFKARTIAFQHQAVALAGEGVQVQIRQADTLSLAYEFGLSGDTNPEELLLTTDGSTAAVLDEDGNLGLYDSQGNAVFPRWIPQGDVTAFAFDVENALLTNGSYRSVLRSTESRDQVAERIRPPLTGTEIFYRYLAYPFYVIFPKPNELNRMVAHLLSELKPEPIAAAGFSIAPEAVPPTPATTLPPPDRDMYVYAIWSNAAFIGVALLLGCMFVSRKDY